MANVIIDHTSKALQLAAAFRDKWTPVLSAQLAQIHSIAKELVYDPIANGEGEKELSVHAQYILEECLDKFRDLMNEMLKEHRQIHPPISKCGKDLDRYFQSDLSNLMRNEKNIETNPTYRHKASQLIFEHLLALGRIDIAEKFIEESEFKFEMPPHYDAELIRSIMEPFRNRSFLPAIRWIQENAPEKRDLLFRLHSQHIIQLLESGNKRNAVLYCRELQPFADKYKDKISHLMFMAVSYPNINKDRYNYLFHESHWLSLEEDLATSLSEFRCPLSTLINVGAKAIPLVLTLRNLTRRSSNSDISFLIDELPCDVPIPERVHSSFACPILKTQGTENNPPMRLSCGHVISMDALNKLASQSRNQRLKCPYCPEESNLQEAVRIYF